MSNAIACGFRWIALDVCIVEHPLVGCRQPQNMAAWMWLLANAEWKDTKVNHKGKTIELKRGQIMIGRAYLAKEWGWSEQNVRTFLSRLVSENMLEINQSEGHYANVATICNYDKYQTSRKADQPVDQPEPNQRVTRAQPEGNQTLTNTTSSTSVSESASARENTNEVEAGHGVIVNCETIRHRAFTISLPAIRLNTIASGRTAEQIKTDCLAHALQWAAEIEGGKRPDQVVPGKIANFLSASIMGAKNRQEVGEVRREKAAASHAYRPKNEPQADTVAAALARRIAAREGTAA